VDLIFERRNPMRVVLVDFPGEVDESFLVLFVADRANGEGAVAHGTALAVHPAFRQ
jgi:hypothetical protein